MSTLDLRHLRYFAAVAATEHIGRAAADLGMAQPPLSRAILSLEAELGVALFERGARGVRLSPSGAALLPEARRLLRDAEAFRTGARQFASGEAGTLAIGFVSTAAYNVLPGLLPGFRARRPGVRVVLREATSDVQPAALVAGDLDLGFLIPSTRDPALAYLPVHRERLIAALPARRRWPAAPDARRLVREPLILFPRAVAPSLHDAVLGWCRQGGAEPSIEQEAVQMQTIVSLVAAGMGISLVPASLAHLKRTGVVYRPLHGGGPTVSIALAWRRADDSPLTRAFVGEASALFGTDDPPT